jgi:hypothetical protein
MRHRKPGQTSEQSSPKPDHSAGKKKKRKTNTLGLTPGDDSGSDEGGEDDEEARLLKVLGSNVFQCVESQILSTAEVVLTRFRVKDAAGYLVERRSRFPTASRVQAKLAKANGPDKFASALERKQQMAEKLRKQLEKVESSIKRKREQQDEGDEMRGSVSSLDDEDDKPEELHARPQLPAIPPPAKKADVSKHCKYFSTGGTCGKKGKCRFVHDPAVREAALKERQANNGHLTIRQRLILNDKEQEDLAVLESMQYLLDKGATKAASLAEGSPESGEHGLTTQQTSTLAMPHHSLPKPPVKRDTAPPAAGQYINGHPPHPSLPQPPVTSSLGNLKGKYQDWNLGGYGNSGVKSEDLP